MTDSQYIKTLEEDNECLRRLLEKKENEIATLREITGWEETEPRTCNEIPVTVYGTGQNPQFNSAREWFDAIEEGEAQSMGYRDTINDYCDQDDYCDQEDEAL